MKWLWNRGIVAQQLWDSFQSRLVPISHTSMDRCWRINLSKLEIQYSGLSVKKIFSTDSKNCQCNNDYRKDNRFCLYNWNLEESALLGQRMSKHLTSNFSFLQSFYRDTHNSRVYQVGMILLLPKQMQREEDIFS